ncbi:MAG TPA: HEPN domain-containing protein [Candidatus Thermoplasmatota archaeon]
MSEADELLDQARTRLKEAEALLQAGLYEGAVSRSYYAAFSAARAMLAADGTRTKTHRGVIQQFGKSFVRSGMAEVRLGRGLAQLHRRRELADYGTGHAIVKAEADSSVALATDMVQAAARYIGQ